MAMQRSSAPTITDVAQRAGVSMKTVSRVLNDEPNVQPQMRERVMAAVAELDYKPNVYARSLARSRSCLLGLVYFASSAAFVGGVQRGATTRCRELGYHLVVEPLEDDARDVEQQLRHLMAALRPDGLILVPPVGDNAAVLKILADARMPCVLISPGDPAPGCAHVSMDDTRAAREMTEYLLRLGHRRIGFIEGPPSQVAAPRRRAGHLAALRAAGISVDESLIVPGDFRFRSGLEGCDRLLDLPNPPTALFASNDDMAMGAVVAAQRRGLQVPADLSVAGFDDSPLASLVWPQLTTVRQPVAEMGVAAVDRLVSREPKNPGAPPAAGRPVPADASAPASAGAAGACPATDPVLPHELMLRGSTAAPPA